MFNFEIRGTTTNKADFDELLVSIVTEVAHKTAAEEAQVNASIVGVLSVAA